MDMGKDYIENFTDMNAVMNYNLIGAIRNADHLCMKLI